MKFWEWLKENINKLANQTSKLKEEKFYDEEGNFNSWLINYSHEMPCDSWDRLFALFILDCYPELIKKEFKDLPKEIQHEFSIESGTEGSYAYNNYEREWISNDHAWENLTIVAEKGREAVLKDSYEDGGWFGAA